MRTILSSWARGTNTFAGGIVIAASVAACGSGPAQDPAIRTIRIYDLLTAFPRVTIQTPAPNFVQARIAAVGQENRRVLFMHPTSSAEFPPIEVGADSILTFAIGIEEEAWDKGGDGVEFTVQVRNADAAPTKMLTLFSRYIDPKHNPDDRRWISTRIPLRRFADQAIQLVFRTSPGPMNDNDSDWAVWGQPQIELDGPAK
jgi:hypothetical protein